MKDEAIEISTGSLAQMLPNPDNVWGKPHVYELEGPPQAYFEIPLDWFANDNAEIEPGHSDGAVRLVQRVTYYSFILLRDTEAECQAAANLITDGVRAEIGKHVDIGYLWWRKRPEFTLGEVKKGLLGKKQPKWKVWLRLGTCPTLPTHFWKTLSERMENISSDPVGGQGKFR